jgi:hypothetical protein
VRDAAVVARRQSLQAAQSRGAEYEVARTEEVAAEEQLEL